MKTKLVIPLAVAVTMLAGCALQNVKPSDVYTHIDPISITSQTQMHADVSECARYANRAVKKARSHAIWGAIIGGLAGAAVGAAVGHGTGYANELAGYGAVQGLAMGGVATLPYARTKQQRIIFNCLIHRGYQLLY